MRAVVVARRPAGEGSARVSLYTDGMGLIEALAKSAREERSQLRAHLVEGTTGLFTFVRGERFWRVTGVTDSRNVYFSSGFDGERKEATARVIGTIRQFVRGEGSDPFLFAALWGFLGAAPSLPAPSLAVAECVAVLKIMSALGYVSASPVSVFLDMPYTPPALEAARVSRAAIVSVINEGIAASGLS